MVTQALPFGRFQLFERAASLKGPLSSEETQTPDPQARTWHSGGFSMKVPIVRVTDRESAVATFARKLDELSDRIRRRAYELFESRGWTNGADIDDWLQAERELTLQPQANLQDRDSQFRLDIDLAEFRPEQVHVTAYPDAIIVEAESRQQDEQRTGDTVMQAFGYRKVLRRFDLPAPIDMDKTQATLTRSVLTISAPKAAAKQVAAAKPAAKTPKAASASHKRPKPKVASKAAGAGN
jgi:HSP20 family molecular chaperone IbpA